MAPDLASRVTRSPRPGVSTREVSEAKPVQARESQYRLRIGLNMRPASSVEATSPSGSGMTRSTTATAWETGRAGKTFRCRNRYAARASGLHRTWGDRALGDVGVSGVRLALSCHDGLVRHDPELRLHVRRVGIQLRHHHTNKLLFRIHPEGGVKDAAP